MKTRTRLFLLPVVLATLAGGLLAADRFDRTKARIDTLLGRRLHPVDLPEKPADPFAGEPAKAAAGAGRGALFDVASDPAPAGKTDAAGVPTTGDDDVLAFFADQLKINGQVQINGQPLIIINQSPYKEGELVQVHAKDGVTYFLRVVKISPNQLTVGYNDAVRTIPIRN